MDGAAPLVERRIQPKTTLRPRGRKPAQRWRRRTQVKYTGRMNQRRPPWRVVGAVSGLALLAISALQLHAVESRLVTQSQQLRALGEATERMAAQLERVRGGGGVSAAEASAPLGKVRHPEVEDYLKPKETHWPPAGANTAGTIAIGWPSGDPKGFNPLIENAAEFSDKLRVYVESEIAKRNSWTDPDAWYGDLAWRIEVRDEFKEFTIYLRKGVKWHPVSGVDLTNPRYAWLNKEHELTAHDYVFAFDMLMHPQVQNGFIKSYYSELASWKALDDYTLELKWNKTQALNVEYSLSQISPLPRFLFAFFEDGTPIPENALGQTLNQHWYNNKGLVGTGPYRFVEYTPGVQMRLERNEDYYGELPALKSVRYPIYTDATQTVLKLKSGELTFGGLRAGQYREEVLQFQNVPEAQRPKSNPFANGELKCDIVDQPSFSYIGWNAENPLFEDKRVRRAMTLSFNRQEILTKVFSNLGRVARGPYLEATPYHAPEIQPLPFDLKQASALLHEAGWSDSNSDGVLDKDIAGKRTPFEFTLLLWATSPEWSSLANIFKEDLLSIGVKMNIEAAEWSLMQKRMDEKKFDAFSGAWGLDWSTDPYQIFHSSQADIPKGSNRIGFRNKKGDALIDELRVTLDPEKRTEMLREFHRILHEEQPYSFAFVPKAPFCHRRGLENVIYAKDRPTAKLLPWWSTRVEG